MADVNIDDFDTRTAWDFFTKFLGKKVLEEEIEQVFYTGTPLKFFTPFSKMLRKNQVANFFF